MEKGAMEKDPFLCNFSSILMYESALTEKVFECSSEYDTLGTSVKAALVYLGTALVKVGFLKQF